MYRLVVLVFLALAVGSCASLPDNCSAGQTVLKTSDGWACADPIAGVQSHTHQLTEIRTSCEKGQVVVWDEQASGWICTEAADRSHEDAEMFTPSYYWVDISAGSEEDLASSSIEGHRYCALNEIQTTAGGRCEVLQTPEGFTLQAWARPESRTECAAVCF